MPTLSTIAQGSERPVLTITWTHADNTTGEDLTNAVITGYVKNLTTGVTVQIQGAIAVTDAAAGVFTWTPDPFDVAEDGAYQVQFSATWPGEPTPGLTAVFDWEISESIIPTDPPSALPDYQGVVKLLARTTDPDAAPEDYYGLFVKNGALWLIDELGALTAFDDGSTAAAAAIAAHVGESDPHTGYLTEASAASTYSTTGHSHAGYAATGHTHAYAADPHTHDYAATTHDHDADYSATTHNHDLSYSATGHNHDGDYATDDHTHTGFATDTHNHDVSYSASGHNHDAAYISVIGTPTEGNLPTITAGGELANSAYAPSSFSASGHDHDSDYSATDHDHDSAYSATGHTHDYAATGHTHDYSGDYISIIGTPTAGNIPTITAGGELDNSAYSPASFAASGHDHDSDYSATGHTHAQTRYLTLGRSGTLTATAGAARLYVPFACTITNVRANVGTAPTGASAIFDVHLDGTTVFTTQGNRPTITATNFTDLTNTPDVTSISANSYLTVDVDQIGSTIAGADLMVVVEVTV